MSFPKKIFYDWGGANETLFTAVNGMWNYVDLFNYAMVLISRLTSVTYFVPFLFAMVFCAILEWAMRKIRKRGGADHVLVAWFGALCVVTVAVHLDGMIVSYFKQFFAYPRPYVVLAPEDITLLEYRSSAGQDYRSMPSGHVSFVSVLVFSLWPVLTSNTQFIGLFSIFLVSLSRVKLGVHFPADCLYAFLLAIFVTVPVRWFIYSVLLKLFKLKC